MSVSLKNKHVLNRVKQGLLFLLLVIVPWLLIVFYTLTMAHPRYTSEAQVVVKQTTDNNMASGTGLVALLGGVSTSVEDSNYLTQYILSLDMVKRLDPQFKFKQNYYIDGSDPVNELDPDATQEEVFEYFKHNFFIVTGKQIGRAHV